LRNRIEMSEDPLLERLARITALARAVWEDDALAHEFLTSPQPQRGGERPIDLARSEPGPHEVERLLK
jgi:putative toxin-antitoxin system antitoxin component (TIGR02293 family)